jgi:hypothetical protein
MTIESDYLKEATAMDRLEFIEGLKICANGEPCRYKKQELCPFSPQHNDEVSCCVTVAKIALELLGCEVWNSYSGKQITAPKGTFEAIYNDCCNNPEEDGV